MQSKRKLSRSPHHLGVNGSGRKLKIVKSPDESSHSSISRRSITTKGIKFNNLRPKAVSISIQQTVLQIENQDLWISLSKYPLKAKIARFYRQMNCQGKEMVVISKIQEFYFQYNNFYNSHYGMATSVEWIIITNAINNEQTEAEFNKNYEPITFVFFRNVQEVVNWLNFKKINCSKIEYSLRQFSSIINFQAYKNDFAIIMEHGMNQISNWRPKSNELWLVQPEFLQKLPRTGQWDYYFLSESSLKEDRLILNQNIKKIVYIITDQFDFLLRGVNIRELQLQLQEKQLRSYFSRRQLKCYYEKIIENYLLHQIIYCLIGFPDIIVSEFEKTGQYVCVVTSYILIPGAHAYTIYYQESLKQKTDVLGLVYNKLAQNSSNQIGRIQTHFQNIKRVQDSYDQLKQYALNVVFITYNLDEDHSFAQEIKHFLKISIFSIRQLNEVAQFENRQVVIITNQKTENFRILDQYSNATLICSKDADTKIAHSSLINYLINRKIKQQNPCETRICSKVLSFNIQFPQIDKDPNICIRSNVYEFNQTLQAMESNNNYMILMQMQDYQQEKEQIIKQIELINNIHFEVYLKYGNEFIFRTNDSKYTFLKKEQLITKINQIMAYNKRTKLSILLQRSSHQNELQQLKSNFEFNAKSDIIKGDNRYQTIPSTYSTPLLNYYPHKQHIFICIPKTVPHHSLANRSEKPYTLLVYNNVQQIKHFISNLSDHHFAAIITTQQTTSKEKNTNFNARYEFFKVTDLSEKLVREQLDRVIDRLSLSRKNGGIYRYKKGVPAVVIYDSSDQKQVELISKMNEIFKTSKILTISKKQFKSIKREYTIYEKLAVFQMGRAEIAFARRLKNIIDLFKIYMSPYYSSHEYTSQKLEFSLKQLFLRWYHEQTRKQKLKHRFQDINLQRSLSPKSKSIMPKECFTSEPGLIVMESVSINKLMRKQKFKDDKQLISTLMNGLSKGNIFVVVLAYEQFQLMKAKISSKVLGIVWVVVTNDFKYSIVRSQQTIFCNLEQLQSTITIIVEKYRSVKEKGFSFKIDQRISEGLSNFELSEVNSQAYEVIIKSALMNQPKIEFHQNLSQVTFSNTKKMPKIQMIYQVNSKNVQLERIANNSFIFLNEQSIRNTLSSLLKQKAIKNDESFSLIEASLQPVYIVCQIHNKKFVQQSIKLIQESLYLLITFQQMCELLSYCQMSKTIIILEKQLQIKANNTLQVEAAETPHNFSNRLAVFIEAVRKST